MEATFVATLSGTHQATLLLTSLQDSARAALCGSEEDSTDPSFVCERVCTSNRLLRRMGGLAKDPTPGTCVTVCGVGCALHAPCLAFLSITEKAILQAVTSEVK